jgi:hypothetical protein
LPGKLAVKGLPGAKRRDAKAAGRSDLDWELSRRHHAQRGRMARRLVQARSAGMRGGGWPGWRRVRGNGAAAAARAVRPYAEAAGQAAAPRRRDSPRPGRLWRASPDRPALSAGAASAHCMSPAEPDGPARRRRALERRKESCHTSDNTCCPGSIFGGFRWPEGGRGPQTAIEVLTTHVYSSA